MAKEKTNKKTAKPTDRKQNFEIWILFFQVRHSFVEALLASLRFVGGVERAQFVLLHPSERKDDVGTNVRIDVFRPVCEIIEMGFD